MEWMAGQIRRNRRCEASGVVSICSANRFVLDAVMKWAGQKGCPLCIETTSNQVNQFGGYIGRVPQAFVRFILRLAEENEFPTCRLILGGDHLGPNPWQDIEAPRALEHSYQLVHDYIAAGYTKIHLDTSMACSGDVEPSASALDEETIAQRTAALCEVSEKVARERSPRCPMPVYVVGTEVPTPGGATGQPEALKVSSAEEVEKTIRLVREAFLERTLDSAWERVIGIVVQPGVEFGVDSVTDYDPNGTRELVRVIKKYESLAYEAHSTDYQTRKSLTALVRNHFAILKVGPGLTFALREALIAMECIEREYLSIQKRAVLSNLSQVLDDVMLRRPLHWKNHYYGDAASVSIMRRFSLSDRCRYYWTEPEVHSAVEQLVANFDRFPPPLSLVSQFLPRQYDAIRSNGIPLKSAAILRYPICEVLDSYFDACNQNGEEMLGTQLTAALNPDGAG